MPNKDDTLKALTQLLPSLSAEQLAAILDLTQFWQSAADPVELASSSAERAAIARSRADFAEGRTFSLEEAEAHTADFLARRRA